ncbi:DnaJ-like protein xdj1 [Neophaeococcomyces mojaviensis]|uniref:DnaJ-like protein xdj1 n=1 Tax=Neophaeococcomyces mojaviensis TaxID=3383035 RepID=A0ACC2ZT23_9EURO|nr:DnaJ-like protein xdj1 [Knufia sp. JES_112]
MDGMNGSSADQIDLYEILSVDKGASKSEIKKAYHKAALANHPDKVPADQREAAEARFKAASQAYEILYDDQKRQLYDTHGMAAFEGGAGGPGGMGVNMEDILGGLFGMNMGGMGGMGGMGRGPQRPRRSPDENQKYEVSLEDLYKGKTVRFSSTKNVICSKCSGSGAKEGVDPRECATCKGQGVRQVVQQVGPGMLTQRLVECSACEGTGKVVNPKDKCKKCKGKRTTEEKKQLELYIPRGAKEGDKIVLEGEADQIPGAEQTGDIIFHLIEQPHDVFNRAGPDLQATLEITLAEALTGFSRVVITHLDGRGISLTHPQVEGEIMRPGQVIKVQGEGMPYKKSDAKGDLYLIVDIQFPEDGFFSDPAAVEALRKLLPPPEAPIKTDVVDEATWEDADPEEFGKGDPRGGGPWVDEDEAGDGPQCATQ